MALKMPGEFFWKPELKAFSLVAAEPVLPSIIFCQAWLSNASPLEEKALVFWFWMWGVPGAIFAVPMLAIAKIICDDVKPLNAIGHFLEG